jgi:hypothetical protein
MGMAIDQSGERLDPVRRGPELDDQHIGHAELRFGGDMRSACARDTPGTRQEWW